MTDKNMIIDMIIIQYVKNLTTNFESKRTKITQNIFELVSLFIFECKIVIFDLRQQWSCL